MKNIIVIGGCGFLGSHLVERLLKLPGVERVTVFDNLTSGRVENLPVDDRMVFIRGRVEDFEDLCGAMEGHDTVFHLAANPDIAKAGTTPTIDFEQGTYLTQCVVEAMRLKDAKKLFYASGSGVYGEAHQILFEDYGPMEPISTYGASKLASEALICAYAHMFGITARAFRFANIVGPRQTHGVGYDFLRRLKQNRESLKILGDGTQTKSYVHIQDVLSAIFLVAERCVTPEFEEPLKYAVYNVGTLDALTVTQIAEMAVMASGIPPGFVRFDYGLGDRGWKGDVPKVRLNYGKIHALGWRASFTSKDAVWMSLLAMAEEIK
jgi:UDP-glucose 4-epimerase